MADTPPLFFSSFSAFLDWHRARIEPVERDAAVAWWDASTLATPQNEARAAETQKAQTRLYSDRAAFAYLRDLDTAPLTPDERRQHRLLYLRFAGNQMEDAVIEELVDTERRIETRYNTHRPLFDGKPSGENALREILRTSDDSLTRRHAWEATKEIGPLVRDDVLHLVALRNAEARKQGYANYYEMALALQEQEVESVFALLNDLAAQTEPLFRDYKARLDDQLRRRFRTETLYPWHFFDPFFQEAPPGDIDFDRFYQGKNLETLTATFFERIGLDVSDLLSRSDLYERADKSEHAFCLHVGRFEDVRVLCNCTDTERWMGTMLHEFGHAVYDRYLGDDLPFFLREVSHTLTTEAVAQWMGRLSKNAAFLTEFVGVSPEEAADVAAAGQRQIGEFLLIFVRWVLVMAHFERAMYENPARDLNRLWWQLVETFQGVTPPPDRNAPDWAAKLHLALAPVYYHNYLLGEMMASQVLEYVRTAVLGNSGDTERSLVTSPLVGDYFRRSVFAPGARLRWDELIRSATGEPLQPGYFVRHLKSAT
ncbi:MAG: M2 family metallopeptidase [Capsulimonadales bacterium]|nr:M2 family metallopeptidase [Capsulimonadales bacterium]